MKLHCSKCAKQLTTDLYKVKVSWQDNDIFNWWKVFEREPAYDIDEEGNETYKVLGYTCGGMKSGLFVMSLPVKKYNNKWDDKRPAQILRKVPSKIVVGKGSVFSELIPPYYEGCGCCDHSGTEWVCECGNELGHLYLDCYQDNSVHFHQKAVRRSYK